MTTQVSIIVAMSLNGVIGHKNQIPWYIPDDLKYFAKITTGHTVIMGRKTYESIIQKLGHPLKGRLSIVLTKKINYEVGEGCFVVESFEEALKISSGEVFVIGGEQIYELALPYADKIYLTIVEGHFDGDVFFPKINKNDWEEICIGKGKYDNIKYSFMKLKRKKFIDINHSRTPEQTAIMKKIEADGVCPFCMENFKKYHTKPIIKEGVWWMLTENFVPYKGTKLHLLIVYKHHAVKLEEIDPKAGTELVELLSWIEKKYNLDGGSLFMRFGETDLTGSSVNHIHLQIIVGEVGRSKESSPLRIKLGYKKAKD